MSRVMLLYNDILLPIYKCHFFIPAKYYKMLVGVRVMPIAWRESKVFFDKERSVWKKSLSMKDTPER